MAECRATFSPLFCWGGGSIICPSLGPPLWFPICSYLNKKKILFWTGVFLCSGCLERTEAETKDQGVSSGKVVLVPLEEITPLTTNHFIYKIY